MNRTSQRSTVWMLGCLASLGLLSLDATAYELDLNPRSQFHIASGGAEFDYGYMADGHFAYAKNFDPSGNAVQYTVSRFTIVPETGDLARQELVDVQVTVSQMDVGGGTGCVNIRTVTPFATIFEACDSSATFVMQLRTNVLYQSETNALARSNPGEHYTEMRFQVPPEVRANTVSAGYGHSCAIRSDSSVGCWGYDGDGETLPLGGSFKEISAGLAFTCGLRSDGTLACWGRNNFGQAAPPAGAFVAVTTAYEHGCGIRDGGLLACWGRSTVGSTSITTPPGGTFVAVSAGVRTTCAIRSDASLVCWGDNYEGKAVPPTGSFKALSVGVTHGCAVRTDGTLACWGRNGWSGNVPPPSGTYVAISAGERYSCAVRSDGAITCWGESEAERGQMNSPAGNFVSVSSGYAHSCAEREDNTIACWGLNAAGQAPRLKLLPETLPQATAGSAYSQQFSLVDSAVVISGNGVYTPVSPGFAAVAGGPAPGLALSAAGHLSGTPVTSGNFPLTVEGEDANRLAASDSYTLAVSGGIDTSPPVIASTISGLLGDGGWYRGNVSVGWSITDAESSIASALGCGPTVVSTDTGGVSVTCTATSLGGTASKTETVKLDGTAPETSISSGPDDPSSSAQAQFEFQGSDSGSGVSRLECRLDSGPFTSCESGIGYDELADGPHAFAVRTVDRAGNVDATPAEYAWIVRTDSTAPVIVPVVTGTPGSNGWYTSDVMITWTVFDNESVVSTSGCAASLLASDTTGMQYSCSATSAGGSASSSVTVKRDATSPVLVPALTPTSILLNGVALATANASDAMSGIATQSCPGVETASVGSHGLTCSAVDHAGNTGTAAVSYSVVYGFGGFTPPVDNPPAVNSANAGRTVPFKWRLVDALGMPVTNLAGVTLRISNLNCDGSAITDEVEQYVTDGAGFINHGNGDYQFNWKSPAGFQATCKRVNLDMADGADHEALFRFH